MKRFGQYITEAPEIKTVHGPVRNLDARLRSINKYLADTVGKKYYQQIPLYDIFKCLEQNGLEPVQEDGTAWAGVLTGREGRANFDLVDFNTRQPVKKWLHMTWHKMDVSGKYEIVAYVN